MKHTSTIAVDVIFNLLEMGKADLMVRLCAEQLETGASQSEGFALQFCKYQYVYELDSDTPV